MFSALSIRHNRITHVSAIDSNLNSHDQNSDSFQELEAERVIYCANLKVNATASFKIWRYSKFPWTASIYLWVLICKHLNLEQFVYSTRQGADIGDHSLEIHFTLLSNQKGMHIIYDHYGIANNSNVSPPGHRAMIAQIPSHYICTSHLAPTGSEAIVVCKR